MLSTLRTPDPTPLDTNTDAGEKLADIVLGEGLATLPACTRWGECTEGGPASNCCTKLTNPSVRPSIYISMCHISTSIHCLLKVTKNRSHDCEAVSLYWSKGL